VTYAVNFPFGQGCCVPSGDPHQALCARIIDLLREERERLGVSKYAVEQKAGVSQQMVGYVERGLRKPSLEVALRMAAALELDLADIIKAAAKRGPSKKAKSAK
jgi:transcriptional regulator with XRE-family HTH domain